MADNVGGGDHGGGPVFVDIYGTAGRLGLDRKNGGKQGTHGFEGPHPDGPFWLRGLQGRLPLWVAFWGGFFFGHGIVLALSVGALVIGVVAGLTIDPERVNESMTAAIFIMYPIGGLMILFGAWSTITVWRSAVHAGEKKWGIAARGAVLFYLLVWGFTVWNLAT